MKRGRLISLRRKPSLLLVILLRRLSRASSQYSTRISRSETIVFRSADSETLKWQPTLLVLKRWLVLAFVVSFIVLLGALFFASGEAYGKDGGESSPTSGDSGGGGSDKGSSGGDDGGSEAVVPLQIRVALAAVGAIAPLPIKQNPEEEAGAAPIRAAPIRAAPIRAAPIRAAPIRAAPIRATPIRATLRAAPEAESRTGEALPTRTP